MGKLGIVLFLASLVAVIAVRYQRGVRADTARRGAHHGIQWPSVPATELASGSPGTWLIFTTPLCASCDAVKAMIAAARPDHAVRLVDATERVDFADRYEVRRAPTTLYVDRDGRVLDRLVGPEAVKAALVDV